MGKFVNNKKRTITDILALVAFFLFGIMGIVGIVVGILNFGKVPARGGGGGGQETSVVISSSSSSSQTSSSSSSGKTSSSSGSGKTSSSSSSQASATSSGKTSSASSGESYFEDVPSSLYGTFIFQDTTEKVTYTIEIDATTYVQKSGNLTETYYTKYMSPENAKAVFEIDTTYNVIILFEDAACQSPKYYNEVISVNQIGDFYRASDWYVVGDGSFVSGSAWSTSGGVNLYTYDTNAYKIAVEFAVGDLFKLTDGSSWAGGNCTYSTDEVFSNGSLELVSDGYGDYNIQVNTAGYYSIDFTIFSSTAADIHITLVS